MSDLCIWYSLEWESAAGWAPPEVIPGFSPWDAAQAFPRIFPGNFWDKFPVGGILWNGLGGKGP